VLTGGNQAGADEQAACSLAPTGGRVTETVAGGREYLLYVPAGIPGPNAPLVLSLHGWGGNPVAHADASGLDVFADSHKAIVAYPKGVTTPLTQFGGHGTGWDYRFQTSADITFLRDVVADIKSTRCVNPRRVHADGLSMGGPMSQRLACEASDVFASVNASMANDVEEPWVDLVTGVSSPSQECAPDRPISIYFSCGLFDVATPDGCQPAAIAWAQRNGCDHFSGFDDEYGHKRTYSQCDAGTQVIWRRWFWQPHNYLLGAYRDQWFTELNQFLPANPRPW
jgi:polyhydroxybutyrate depolymerase